MNLTCTDCGKLIEPLPLKCAYSININNETNQWECFMENCGYISINEFVCENCCINRNIMRINEKFEQLSLKDEEFRKELGFFKNNTIQIDLKNPDYNFWVEFGNGMYKSGIGKLKEPSISIVSSQNTIYQVFKGNIAPIKGLLKEDLKIDGDIQYAVAFFDLIKLGLEINKEQEGGTIQ